MQDSSCCVKMRKRDFTHREGYAAEEEAGKKAELIL